MQLFYTPLLTASHTSFTFSKEESRHLVKVLRKSEGTVVYSTNGKGLLFTLEIQLANPGKCSVIVIEVERRAKPTYQLHMAVAPTKMNDRYEWFLEKATEIGVTHITPIICERSERKIFKPERYERILQSAMKQSLRCYLPILNPIVSFTDFIKHTKAFNGKKYIAHCEDTSKQNLTDSYKKGDHCIVMIGPEGDFSLNEIKLALSEDFQPITLGTSRLRTETAALVAVQNIAFMNQN